MAMTRYTSFWRNLIRRGRVERDLDDELRATLELLTAEKVRAGMTPEAARRASRLELGSHESLKEQVRDARSGAFLDTLLQDVRYGARLLRRNPLFTFTAALSLAIGIGATTAIFTVANGLLMRAAVGVTDPGSLVDIVRLERGDTGVEPFSYPDYLDLRRRLRTVEGVYGYQLDLEPVSLAAENGAERVFANVVTANFFEVLGVPAAEGRTFGSGDSEQPGSSPVAVLSHRFWTRRFNRDANVIGRTVRVNGHPFTIVGVARDGFRGTSVLAPDLWIPTAMVGIAQPGSAVPRLTIRENGWLMLGARLKPGVTRPQVSSDVQAIGAALAREFPFDTRVLPPGMPIPDIEWSAENASPIPAGMRVVVAGLLALLMAITSVVLVIACANVASILLARGTVRQREIAVRSAIGAARARVIRQLLTETVLLFLLGGAAGLALARVMVSVLLALLPVLPLPVNVSVPLDGRVVAFSLSLALLSAVLSGLTPALQASRTDVVTALKDDAQGPGDRLRLRNAFVVTQVAFSSLLIVMAALFARGLDRVVSLDRGFDPHRVDAASIDLSMAGYTDASGPSFARQLIERVRALPGVESATLTNRLPGPGTMSLGGVTVPGTTPPNGAPFFSLSWTLIESGYFSTLRIPLVAGRDFGPDDREGTEPVAIVGEATARRLWPGKDALGQLMLVTTNSADGLTSRQVPHRVVGVARDVKAGGARSEAPLALYVPLSQRYFPEMTILIRTADDDSRAARLHLLITAMDPNLPVLDSQRLESQLSGPAEVQLRISAAVAGSVGAVGLLLAAIGIYGVTAYAVARRTREIGVRLSLGANRSMVVAMVLQQGMRLVAIGSAAGLALGAAAGRLLSAGRFGVTPLDPGDFAFAALLFMAVGLVACAVPVLRATRIRAMDALRYE
jgi:predicted permease